MTSTPTHTLRASLLHAYSLTTIASARKSLYARKATLQNNEGVSHLLRAIAASEKIQARRLLRSLTGQIDTSDDYLSTIFTEEMVALIATYKNCLELAEQQDNPAIRQALSQLKETENRLQRLGRTLSRDGSSVQDEHYFTCNFCGYLSTTSPPARCPVCSADREAFTSVP